LANEASARMEENLNEPIRVRYSGRDILIHEDGCKCEDNHSNGFGPEGRTCILTTYDADEDKSYYQVWHRVGRWTLREALDALMKRCGGSRERIVA